MRNVLRRPSPALVVSVIALIVALGGTGYAALKIPKSSVGSKQLKNGAVTTKKIKNDAVTGAKIKLSTLGTVPSAAIATNATNATNASNAANASTLGGEPASAFQSKVLSAVVVDNGSTSTVVRGSPGVTATRVGTGETYVHMGRDVSGCTWIATVGNPGSEPLGAAFATVRGNAADTGGSVNDVNVITFATNQSGLDVNFHLAVIC